MNKFAEAALGISPAAIVRGVRFGPRQALRAARRSFSTAAPFERGAIELGPLGLPEITLDTILGSRKAAIALNVMAYEDGMLPLRDALPLLSIAVAEQPRSIVEIGTYMGHTARALAQNLPDATVHTIDLPPDFSPAQTPDAAAMPKDDFHLIAKRRVGREFLGTKFEQRIVQHFGDTAQMDFAALGPASFFFIDGSHTYEYCRSDTEKCLEIARPGAVFLWHDCDETHVGVVRALKEFRAREHDVAVIAGTALGYWKNPDAAI